MFYIGLEIKEDLLEGFPALDERRRLGGSDLALIEIADERVSVKIPERDARAIMKGQQTEASVSVPLAAFRPGEVQFTGFENKLASLKQSAISPDRAIELYWKYRNV